MRYYITPDDYETAIQNGIDEQRVYERVYTHRWDVESAITEPVRSYNKLDQFYIDRAKGNGIAYGTFYARVKRGMSQKEASEKALLQHNREEAKRLADLSRLKTERYKKETYENLEKNNIDRGTFYARIRSGWTEKEASTIQVMSSGRKRNTANHAWRKDESMRLAYV